MMRNGLLIAALIVTTGCSTVTPRTIGSPTPMADGLLFYQDGQYVAAHDAFDQAVRGQPGSADAYANRGVTRMRLGNLTGAIEDLSTAITLAPRDPVLFYNRGNVLVAAGHPELAIGDYTRAVEINPLYARAWFNRGSARALARQHEAAVADWRHAMEIEPDPWTRYSMQRSARLTAAMPADPQGRPTTVGTVAPAPPPSSAAGGVLLPPAGERTPGTEPLARDPAASPGAIDARALATRAITRELDGDRPGAIADLRAALELEPDPGRRAAITGLMQYLEAGR
jgi:tetratricopeptide (TPR) repeat protein